ncbi:MAG TPA: tetratricopeptide repeat protein [Vicinamibacteria bacterium]|nr:tetratricopeptide repeat protein [Vicinamibacteria bacterium]
MKAMFSTLVVAVGLAAGEPLAAQGTGASATPAERRIEQARQALGKAPANSGGHVDLAMALARRARETSDPAFYAQAEKAISEALDLNPDGFEALKVRAWVLLGQHRFGEARALAETLNKRVPDDVMVYGLLTDANVELGDYERAERACQWMLNLRPGNIPALTRAAYLRELFGDVDGAMELMAQALDSTPASETEDRAWLLTQMAHLRLMTGKAAEAEKLLDEALASFPAYHYALAQLAKVRAGQGRHAEAATLLRQRYDAAPHPENLYDLAVALERAGSGDAAKVAFAEFETKALAETHDADNANRELIFYYADHAQKAAEAVAVARREIARRRDLHTLDAHAWALFRNGRFAESRKVMERALAVGVREASILYHAGAIAAKLGERGPASERLRQSLELNAVSDVAADARRELARLR